MSAHLTIEEYLDRLASAAPAPGGGSVAGLVSALAAALGTMVSALSSSAPGTDAALALADASATCQSARSRALKLAREDEAAYEAYVSATKLPKANATEIATRRLAMQDGLRHAADVPMRLAETVGDLLAALIPIARHGNRHLVSDVRIAAMLAAVAGHAALINVRVNTALLKDRELGAQLEREADLVEARVNVIDEEITSILQSR